MVNTIKVFFVIFSLLAAAVSMASDLTEEKVKNVIDRVDAEVF